MVSNLEKRLYKRIADVLGKAEAVVLIVLLLFTTLLSFVQVVSRKLLHLQWSATEEVVVALFVLNCMIGAANCVR